jgi:hypothetical protein
MMVLQSGGPLATVPEYSFRVPRFLTRYSGCTITVYNGATLPIKQVRRSVTLPTRLAEQVGCIARKRRLSDNRVLVELIEQGLEAQKEKEKAFFALAGRFRSAADPKEVKQLGDEMGRFVFGN